MSVHLSSTLEAVETIRSGASCAVGSCQRRCRMRTFALALATAAVAGFAVSATADQFGQKGVQLAQAQSGKAESGQGGSSGAAQPGSSGQSTSGQSTQSTQSSPSTQTTTGASTTRSSTTRSESRDSGSRVGVGVSVRDRGPDVSIERRRSRTVTAVDDEPRSVLIKKKKKVKYGKKSK